LLSDFSAVGWSPGEQLESFTINGPMFPQATHSSGSAPLLFCPPVSPSLPGCRRGGHRALIQLLPFALNRNF
jgi:hypothetical protein